VDQPLSVPRKPPLSSLSEAKGVERSSATERMGAPNVVAVKAPQVEVMAVPLICVSCCVTTDQAGTRRMRMASSVDGLAGAKEAKPSAAARGVSKSGCTGAVKLMGAAPEVARVGKATGSRMLCTVVEAKAEAVGFDGAGVCCKAAKDKTFSGKGGKVSAGSGFMLGLSFKGPKAGSLCGGTDKVLGAAGVLASMATETGGLVSCGTLAIMLQPIACGAAVSPVIEVKVVCAGG